MKGLLIIIGILELLSIGIYVPVSYFLASPLMEGIYFIYRIEDIRRMQGVVVRWKMLRKASVVRVLDSFVDIEWITLEMKGDVPAVLPNCIVRYFINRIPFIYPEDILGSVLESQVLLGCPLSEFCNEILSLPFGSVLAYKLVLERHDSRLEIYVDQGYGVLLMMNAEVSIGDYWERKLLVLVDTNSPLSYGLGLVIWALSPKCPLFSWLMAATLLSLACPCSTYVALLIIRRLRRKRARSPLWPIIGYDTLTTNPE